MKKLLFIFFALISIKFSLAQCQQFTNDAIEKNLGDYLLSGRVHTFTMKEGEELLIFKTVDARIKYKFVVLADENLPQQVILVIKSWDDSTIFDNRNNNLVNSFEYSPEKSQRIKIYIKVPQFNTPPKEGCVTLLIGMRK